MYTQLKQLIEQSERIVFFGGAGVSTQSGIPDFRSADGIYQQQYPYPPETMISHSFFISHTADFFKFYKDKMLFPNALPNHAHKALAHLEKLGKIKAVITQNIDGLHQAAGSKKVFELHGSVHRNYCMECSKSFTLKEILNENEVPHCSCGGIIKPDVVLYEEPLKDDVIQEAVAALRNSDLLIVGGTSLNVYPAAGMIDYFGGKKLVLINKSPTRADKSADLVIREPIGDVFRDMFPELFQKNSLL